MSERRKSQRRVTSLSGLRSEIRDRLGYVPSPVETIISQLEQSPPPEPSDESLMFGGLCEELDRQVAAGVLACWRVESAIDGQSVHLVLPDRSVLSVKGPPPRAGNFALFKLLRTAGAKLFSAAIEKAAQASTD